VLTDYQYATCGEKSMGVGSIFCSRRLPSVYLEALDC
jgi:hypothetical protein